MFYKHRVHTSKCMSWLHKTKSCWMKHSITDPRHIHLEKFLLEVTTMTWQCIRWTCDCGVQVNMSSQWVTVQQHTQPTILSSWNYAASGWLPDMTIQDMNFSCKLWCKWDTVQGATENLLVNTRIGIMATERNNEMWQNLSYTDYIHLLTTTMNLTRYMKVMPDVINSVMHMLSITAWMNS